MFPLKQMQNHPSSFVNLKRVFLKEKKYVTKRGNTTQESSGLRRVRVCLEKKIEVHFLQSSIVLTPHISYIFFCYLEVFLKKSVVVQFIFSTKMIQPQVKNTSFLLSFYRVICQTSPTDRTPLFAPILRRRVPVVPVSQNIQNSEISSLKLQTLPLRLKKY